MAGARVPGHRGPKTKTPIATAYVVRQVLSMPPLVHKIPVLSRTARTVRVERCTGAGYGASFAADIFDRAFAATREGAIEKWRDRLRDDVETYRALATGAEKLLVGPAPKDAE